MTSRVKALSGRMSRLEALRDRIQDDLVSKKAEVIQLSAQVERLAKVEELFKALMDLLVVGQVRSLENVVTEGLQSIFYDQDLHLESEIGPKYNKISIDFFLRQGAEDDPLAIRGKPTEAFGGGPTIIASLILRLLAVIRLQKFPLLLLDETLHAVADAYTDTTGRFLTALSNKMGVPILMITHNQAYIEHADRAYRGTTVEAPGDTRPVFQIKAVS